MAAIPVGSKVKIGNGTDDTFAKELVGKTGKITGHNANQQTGNTAEDPLHVVKFDDGSEEQFWAEELEALNEMSVEDRNQLRILLREELVWMDPQEGMGTSVRVSLTNLDKSFNKDTVQYNLRSSAKHFNGRIVEPKSNNVFTAVFDTRTDADSFTEYIQDKRGVIKQSIDVVDAPKAKFQYVSGLDDSEENPEIQQVSDVTSTEITVPEKVPISSLLPPPPQGRVPSPEVPIQDVSQIPDESLL